MGPMADRGAWMGAPVSNLQGLRHCNEVMHGGIKEIVSKGLAMATNNHLNYDCMDKTESMLHSSY